MEEDRDKLEGPIKRAGQLISEGEQKVKIRKGKVFSSEEGSWYSRVSAGARITEVVVTARHVKATNGTTPTNGRKCVQTGGSKLKTGTRMLSGK